jgi:putative endonuclease
MQFCAYIIYSPSADKFYVGHSDDLERRLFEHNSGQTRYTSNIASDWKIMYSEAFSTRSDAMKREKEIKSKKKRSYIEQLIANAG